MKLLRLTFVPFALLAVAAIRILARFGILIRIGEFWSERIGHLGGNTECYLCERDEGMQSGIDIWFHRCTPANLQLAKMQSRVMRVDPTGFARIVSLCDRLFPGWERNAIQPIQLDRDINNLWCKHYPHLEFTREEEERGEKTLIEDIGIPFGAKFVCLIVRDNAYLPQLGYHDFRNADISSYELAAQEFVERGYYVVRMGAKVEKPFRSEFVIDYAANGMRSDFMDVYLGAKCTFCLSSGCGFDVIPAVFRRPICYTNYVPFEYLWTFSEGSLAIWKHHEKDGKRMSVAEIVASGAGQFMRAEEFAQAGITLVDNTAEEIAAVASEMADQMDGWFIRSGFRGLESGLTPEEQFWKSFPRAISPYNKQPLHGEIKMRIGAEFLKGYQ